MKRANIYLLAFTVVLLTAAAGCAKVEQYGAPLSSQAVTKITDIMKNPDGFIGKTVKVEGTIANECPTGCWFYVKDGTGTLYIDLYAANLAIPQKAGKNVTLEGTIEKRSGLPIIQGRGVEIR
jgi:hypothetical protein